MAKKKTKKLNPRRIPMPKSMIDKDKILEEATKDDLYRAWLLVTCALIEQGQAVIEEIPLLTDAVNRYIQSPHFRGDNKAGEIIRAEKIMGISAPYENVRPEQIKSVMDLERFKEKVYKVATHTALCVICLGFDSAKRFTPVELRRLFLNVDLTLSEIDHGCNSYSEIEKFLLSNGVTIERIGDDFHHISIAGYTQH